MREQTLESATSIDDIRLFLADKYLSCNSHKYASSFCSAEKKIAFYNYNDLGDLIVQENGMNLLEGYELTNEEIDSLKSIIENLSSNPLICGYYSHIISKRHHDFKQKTIEYYINVLKSHYNYSPPTILLISEVLIYFSIINNLYKQIIKQEIIQLFQNQEIDVWVKKELTIWIYEKKGCIWNTFKSELKEILSESTITHWVEIYESNNDDFLKVMLRIKQPEVKSIYHLLAENQNKIINRTHGYRIMEELLKKAKYHNYADEKELFQETMTKYNEYKHEKLFPRNTYCFTFKTTNDMSNYITTLKPREIIQHIIECEKWSKNILSINDQQPNIEQTLKDLGISTTSFDINHNIIDTSSATNMNSRIALIEIQIINMIKVKPITFSILRRYLEQTWINQRYLINGKNESWLDVLNPSLRELCHQFTFLSKNKAPNFILAIDSLTPKIEGLIRDFIKYKGGTTTKINSNDTSEEILLEGLINSEPPTQSPLAITDCFTNFELEFIKYILTNKGKNIRNKIAHSFFYSNNYSLEIAIDLLICLLIISSKSIR